LGFSHLAEVRGAGVGAAAAGNVRCPGPASRFGGFGEDRFALSGLVGGVFVEDALDVVDVVRAAVEGALDDRVVVEVAQLQAGFLRPFVVLAADGLFAFRVRAFLPLLLDLFLPGPELREFRSGLRIPRGRRCCSSSISNWTPCFSPSRMYASRSLSYCSSSRRRCWFCVYALCVSV
jgi:hypothetical protein